MPYTPAIGTDVDDDDDDDDDADDDDYGDDECHALTAGSMDVDFDLTVFDNFQMANGF